MNAPFDWSDYDAENSMKMAMDNASKVLRTFHGEMPTANAAVHLSQISLWVQIAQVHATNAQTDAIKAAAKLTWQDDTGPL